MEKETIEGIVTSLGSSYDAIIRIDDRSFALKDIPHAQRDKVKVGDKVSLSFPGKGRYYASGIEILEAAMTKKIDYNEIIRDLEPIMGQEVLDRLNESDRRDLLAMFQHNMIVATKLIAIHATFDDTKKDASDSATKAVSLAVDLTIAVDSNTMQILKKSLPPIKP
jgi:hypothetical protein